MNYKQYEIPTKSDHITYAYINVISTSLLSHTHTCLLQCDLGTVFHSKWIYYSFVFHCVYECTCERLSNNFHITDMSYAQLHSYRGAYDMCICVSYSCTRHITYKLHMHILHGKSLEPKEMHLFYIT